MRLPGGRQISIVSSVPIRTGLPLRSHSNDSPLELRAKVNRRIPARRASEGVRPRNSLASVLNRHCRATGNVFSPCHKLESKKQASIKALAFESTPCDRFPGSLPLRWAIGASLLVIGSTPAAAQTAAVTLPPANVAASAVTPARSFAEVVKSNFALWDLNHDGRFETDELDQLINRPDVRGEAAAALATIKRRQRMAIAAKAKDYSVTEEDLLSTQPDSGPAKELDSARGETKPFRYEANFQRNTKALGKLSRELYAGQGPNFTAMRQGPIGSCFFFAVAGNLAAHQPDRLRRMIERDLRDGYVVHFGDGENVRVTAPTDIEILINNSTYSMEDGLWLTILEKAVGERLHHRVAAYKQTDEETDAIAMGGSTKAIIGLFTGHDVETIGVRDPAQVAKHLARLRTAIPKALAARRLVAVRMGKNPPKTNEKVPKLGYNHAYALFGFDAAADKVTIWNPWGNDYTPNGPPGIENGFETRHGVFQVPLTTLYEQFSSVSVETAKNVPPSKPVAEPKPHSRM